MIGVPILGFKYEVRFKEPINLFDILFPAFIELRAVFPYTTQRDRLHMYDIYFQSLYTDENGNLIDDMEERKRIFESYRHTYTSEIEYELYQLPLYCESKERDRKDRTLCNSMIIYDSESKDFVKYKDFAKYKELEMEKNRILPTIDDCKDYYEKENYYLTSMADLLDLSDERKSILENVLSSQILKSHIKDHGFVHYFKSY